MMMMMGGQASLLGECANLTPFGTLRFLSHITRFLVHPLVNFFPLFFPSVRTQIFLLCATSMFNRSRQVSVASCDDDDDNK